MSRERKGYTRFVFPVCFVGCFPSLRPSSTSPSPFTTSMSSPKPRSFVSGSSLSNIPAYNPSGSSYQAAPTLPNIPLRSTSTPNDGSSPASGSVVDGERKILQPQPQHLSTSNLSASMRQQQSPGLLPSPSPSAVHSPAGSGFAIDPFSSAFNLDTATEEEKATILRRHLVSAQERRQSNAAGNSRPEMGKNSRSSSFRNTSAVEGGERREGPGEDGEEFQLPYHHAGGDVT